MEMQHLLLAIAVRNSMATHKIQPQLDFIIVWPSISLYSLHPLYLSFHSSHVNVRYLKSSNQQIHPKIIGAGLAGSGHCPVYE